MSNLRPPKSPHPEPVRATEPTSVTWAFLAFPTGGRPGCIVVAMPSASDLTGPWPPLDASLPLDERIGVVVARVQMIEAELVLANEKVASLIEAQKMLVGVVMGLVADRNA